MAAEGVHVAHLGNVAAVSLHRPKAGNAITWDVVLGLPRVLRALADDGRVKCVLLHGLGPAMDNKNFCAGADLNMLADTVVKAGPDECPAASRRAFVDKVELMQKMCSALEECRVPVVAAVHGAVYGAAIDLVTAADIVVTDANAKWCVKEIDLAVTADLGTLQRLPRLVGPMRAKELAYTARVFSGHDATAYGLCLSAHESPRATFDAALKIAEAIASKPSVAMRGAKETLLHATAEATSVSDGLRFVRHLNAHALPSTEGAKLLEQAFRSRGIPPPAHAKL